jgi:excisionase family DNA binding protein
MEAAMKHKSSSHNGVIRGDDRSVAGALADERFFTIAEVAELLGVCTRTARRWIDRKKLVAHDFNGLMRIAESDLRDFIALHRRQ